MNTMKKLLVLLFMSAFLFGCSNDNSPEPTAPEFCDNGTFIGVVKLETQAEIDEFGALCYTKIDGTLVIGPNEGVTSDISDLTPLSNLNEVLISQSDIGTGFILIMNTINLSNLMGLNSIVKANGISIVNNSGLTNLSGLDGLTALQSANSSSILVISHNDQLVNVNGLDNLRDIGVESSGSSNNSLMEIQGNANLTNLDGLFNLESLYGFATIGSFVEGFNPELGNPNLNDFCGLTNLLNSGTFEYVNVFNNAFNPSNQDIISGNCSQ